MVLCGPLGTHNGYRARDASGTALAPFYEKIRKVGPVQPTLLYSSSLIQARQRAVTAGRELDVHAIPNVGDLLVRSRRLPNNDGQSVFFGVSSTATTLEVRYLLLRQRLDWSGLHPGVGRLGEGTRGEKGKTDACGK